jgi:hypothetical protein
MAPASLKAIFAPTEKPYLIPARSNEVSFPTTRTVADSRESHLTPQ